MNSHGGARPGAGRLARGSTRELHILISQEHFDKLTELMTAWGYKSGRRQAIERAIDLAHICVNTGKDNP